MNDLLEKISKALAVIFGIPLAILLLLIVLYGSSDSVKNLFRGIVGNKEEVATAADMDDSETAVYDPSVYTPSARKGSYDQAYSDNSSQDEAGSTDEPAVVYVNPDRPVSVVPFIPGNSTDDVNTDQSPDQGRGDQIQEQNVPQNDPDTVYDPVYDNTAITDNVIPQTEQNTATTDVSTSKQKIEVVVKIDENECDRTPVYDSRGLLIKEKYSFNDNDGLDDDGCTVDYSYDANNRLIKAVVSVPGYGAVDTYEYTYNSDGSRKGYTRNGKDMTGFYALTGTVPRDSHGNILKDQYNEYTLTYDGDRLIERKSNLGVKTVYSYKEIEADEKCIDEIKKQQWSLINADADDYFGIVVGWG